MKAYCVCIELSLGFFLLTNIILKHSIIIYAYLIAKNLALKKPATSSTNQDLASKANDGKIGDLFRTKYEIGNVYFYLTKM